MTVASRWLWHHVIAYLFTYWLYAMPPTLPRHTAMSDTGRRRGASPRPKQTPKRPSRLSSWFDRWLDRLVIVAVSIALLVGVLALAMHLYYGT